MIRNSPFLHVMGNEDRRGPPNELDEVKNVNGDWIVSVRVGGVEEVDDGGDAILFMDAGEYSKLRVVFAMHDVPFLVACIFS